MMIIEKAALTAGEIRQVHRLWNQEYPVQLQHAGPADLGTYLNGLTDQHHLLLMTNTGMIAGWAFTFHRDGGKWFAIILDKSIHGMGYGSLLLDKLKQAEPVLWGWVIDHETDKKETKTDIPFKNK